MNRKQRRQTRFSMLPFQDIITSVTGVIMLMTLLLALRLTVPVVINSYGDPEEKQSLITQINLTEDQIVDLQVSLQSQAQLVSELSTYSRHTATAEVRAITEEIQLLETRLAQLREQEAKVDKDASGAEALWQNRSEEEERLIALQQRLQALQQELETLKSSERVFYNPTDLAGREVLLVELFDSDILVAKAGKREQPLRFQGSSMSRDFLAWAANQPTARVRFVLIVHPGTTATFNKLTKDLRGKGYRIGFDLLPESRIAIDVAQGAG